MIGMECQSINDLKPLKIVYWDNSFLYMNGGKPVGLKMPTEEKVDWLDSCLGAEENLVKERKSLDLAMEWDTIEVPNPN